MFNTISKKGKKRSLSLPMFSQRAFIMDSAVLETLIVFILLTILALQTFNNIMVKYKKE